METLFLIALLMHPVHETVSEAEWNTETKRLEVAMRLDVLDEQWLMRRYGKDKPASEWALEYLRKSFRVTESAAREKAAGVQTEGTPGKATLSVSASEPRYVWLGRQDKRSHVWWYFEIVPADGQRPRWIDARMLFERNDGYVNRILVLNQSRRRALTLNRQQSRGNLDPADDEPKASDRQERSDSPSGADESREPAVDRS